MSRGWKAAPGSTRPPGAVRHVIEARHESFTDPACVALCRQHGVALAVTDGIPDWPQFRELTAGFAYVRLHLSDTQERGYDDAAIAGWAERAAAWAEAGHDVFLYFDAAGDETVKLHTPTNAATMLAAAQSLTGARRLLRAQPDDEGGARARSPAHPPPPGEKWRKR